MIKNAKNIAFGLAVTLGFFLIAEGILWISGVEPLYERTDPYVGFADYSPLFVERRTPDGEQVFATANNTTISKITERVESKVDEAANAMALTNLSLVLTWAGKHLNLSPKTPMPATISEYCSLSEMNLRR